MCSRSALYMCSKALFTRLVQSLATFCKTLGLCIAVVVANSLLYSCNTKQSWQDVCSLFYHGCGHFYTHAEVEHIYWGNLTDIASRVSLRYIWCFNVVYQTLTSLLWPDSACHEWFWWLCLISDLTRVLFNAESTYTDSECLMCHWWQAVLAWRS